LFRDPATIEPDRARSRCLDAVDQCANAMSGHIEELDADGCRRRQRISERGLAHEGMGPATSNPMRLATAGYGTDTGDGLKNQSLPPVKLPVPASCCSPSSDGEGLAAMMMYPLAEPEERRITGVGAVVENEEEQVAHRTVEAVPATSPGAWHRQGSPCRDVELVEKGLGRRWMRSSPTGERRRLPVLSVPVWPGARVPPAAIVSGPVPDAARVPLLFTSCRA
jgi:hypothetical protein